MRGEKRYLAHRVARYCSPPFAVTYGIALPHATDAGRSLAYHLPIRVSRPTRCEVEVQAERALRDNAVQAPIGNPGIVRDAVLDAHEQDVQRPLNPDQTTIVWRRKL